LEVALAKAAEVEHTLRILKETESSINQCLKTVQETKLRLYHLIAATDSDNLDENALIIHLFSDEERNEFIWKYEKYYRTILEWEKKLQSMVEEHDQHSTWWIQHYMLKYDAKKMEQMKVMLEDDEMDKIEFIFV